MNDKFEYIAEEKQSRPIDKLPSRVRYYLLDWKDRNMDEYLRRYGQLRLSNLTAWQLLGLFRTALKNDVTILERLTMSEDESEDAAAKAHNNPATLFRRGKVK